MIFNKKTGTNAQEIIFIKRAVDKIKSLVNEIKSKYIYDIKIGTSTGDSIVSNGVGIIPFASASKAGVITASSQYGLNLSPVGLLTISQASEEEIDSRYQYKAITPARLDYSIVKGLSTNGITLSTEQKTAIYTWLGIINLPPFPSESGTFTLEYDNTGDVPSLSWVETT